MRIRGPRIRRQRDGRYLLKLSEDERKLLRSLPGQITFGLGSSDPGTMRLFPPAYSSDPDAEADYQDLVHQSLLEHHRDALAVLEQTASSQSLDEVEAQSWLVALNDIRLVLGTRLDVKEDGDPLPAGHPNAGAMSLYHWLTWLQEQLVEALASAGTV